MAADLTTIIPKQVGKSKAVSILLFYQQEQDNYTKSRAFNSLNKQSRPSSSGPCIWLQKVECDVSVTPTLCSVKVLLLTPRLNSIM